MNIQKTENPIAIKRFIFENEKIEFVLEKIECHSIKYHQQKIIGRVQIMMAIIQLR